MSNILPLDQFRSAFSYNPFHFWQLANSTIAPLVDCPTLVYEQAYQSGDQDSAGRADLRYAIELAEGKIRDWLGYSLVPHYSTLTLNYPRYYDVTLNKMDYSGSDGRWIAARLPEGKIIAVGAESLASLGTVQTSDGSLAFSDRDSDGLLDTFTATFNTAITDPAQLELYFIVSDRLDNEPASERWRIAPVYCSISGGVATFTGRYWLLVKPVLYQSVRQAPLDPATASNFVDTLQVYQHRADPTGTTPDTAQAELIWETRPWPAWATCFDCSSQPFNSTDPAAQAFAVARVGLRDARLGIVSIGEAIWDATTGQFRSVSMSNSRPPDRIVLRYFAGEPLDVTGKVPANYASILSRFAAAEADKRICACAPANKQIYNQQIDRAFNADSRVDKFQMSMDDLNNPFGTREGQVAAWRWVKRNRILGGVGA